jgi:hypothetical protein
MTTPVKIVALVLCAAAALPLFAERRRAIAPPLVSALTIEFVDVPAAGASFVGGGSDASIDLSVVSRRAGMTGKSLRIARQFGIRIARAGAVSSGTALITARLDALDGRSTVRIDGRLVGRTPLVVSSHAPVGALAIHTVEIEIADSVAAGPLASSIAWEVTTQ